MKKKLTVALWVDSMQVPAWVHEMLLRINAGEHASLKWVILNKTNKKKGGSSLAKGLRNFNYIAFILYRKIENRFIDSKPDAQQLKNIMGLIQNNSIIEVHPSHQQNHLIFKQDEIEKLKRIDADVCIKIGNGILPDEILACSRYGFWRFDDGNNFIRRGIYTGVKEVISESEVTQNALLTQLAGKEAPFVLCTGTHATAGSIKKNINLVYWKSVSFIPGMLDELYEKGGDTFINNLKKYDGDLANCYMPSNKVFVPYLLKYYLSKISIRFNRRKSIEQYSH